MVPAFAVHVMFRWSVAVHWGGSEVVGGGVGVGIDVCVGVGVDVCVGVCVCVIACVVVGVVGFAVGSFGEVVAVVCEVKVIGVLVVGETGVVDVVVGEV